MNFNKILYTGLITLTSFTSLFAGNEDRAGSAGASELLINPWAASSGNASANMAGAKGIDAIFLNVAGLAQSEKTEIAFTNTQWLVGSGTQINSAAIAQKVGTSNTFAISFLSMSFGEWDVTTVNQPENGGLGSIAPTYTNIGVSYARMFSNSIYGGATVKIINHTISNAKASGFALDAGIQYVTGVEDQIKFGIALKNVGSSMSFTGDGFSTSSVFTDRSDEQQFTTQFRTAKYELPTSLSIGASYDFIFSENSRLNAAFSFNANSFTKDSYGLGLDYGLNKEKFGFNLRAGYLFENEIFSEIGTRTTATTGLCAGLTVAVGLGETSKLNIDYSYRSSNPFSGSHSIGARFTLK